MNSSQKLLIIGYVWPEPRSSAAGSRMMKLITLFEDAGWSITFASSAAESEYAENLESRGISTAEVQINDSGFDAFLTDLQPDAVLFDRFIVEEQFGWRVAENCPGALRILDTEDLHCLRRTRGEAVRVGNDFNPQKLLSHDVAKREIASIYRCDLSLIISDYEMQLLTNLFGVDEDLLQYLPFMLDPITEDDSSRWPSFEERSHFMTIGNFRHPPNWDSVRYLRSEVWPLVRRKLPEAELHIYGAYPSAKVTQLHKPELGFLVKGRAESAPAVISRARVMLAPLRFGAGLKGKLVEAMQCGTPSVTTPIGAEGLQGDMPWPGTVAVEPKELVAAAVKLCQDPPKWESARQAGIDLINNRLADEKHAAQFMERLDEVTGDLEGHRQKNFTGAMLLHHRSASTRYMAKWIEEKNS